MSTTKFAAAQRQGSTDIALATPAAITNVVALFEALAVGWEEGSTRNRCLLAGDGEPFVRVHRGHLSRTQEMSGDDIPVVVLNHGYRIRGFIQHETRYLYRGMFETWHDDECRLWSAQLTAKGFQFAQAPVFDVASLHRDIAACSFFNPPTKMPASPALGGSSVIARINANLPDGRFLMRDLP